MEINDYPYYVTSGYSQAQQWHCPCCANYNKCPTCGKTGYHPSETPWSPIPWVYDPGPTSDTITDVTNGTITTWSTGEVLD